MTGGPDGDVASNELKILHRKYKDTCKVVAIADGFTGLHDPQGLNWDELLKLINNSESIQGFSKAKLSSDPNAKVVDIVSVENLKFRNEVHNKIKADILIPAVGRPYTVNEDNVSDFIQENGESSCRAIVEGANIFFTDKAREFLQHRGIVMIKDSSANKTGVICSSYEIIASLVLEMEEFLKIKKSLYKRSYENPEK